MTLYRDEAMVRRTQNDIMQIDLSTMHRTPTQEEIEHRALLEKQLATYMSRPKRPEEPDG